MADNLILIDTSILIDFFRKTDKSKTHWIALVNLGYSFAVSTISKFEIFAGAKPEQLHFWQKIFEHIVVLSVDESTVDVAVNVNANLKQRSKQIDIADLLIASTAISNGLRIATLNRKHFERIENLRIIED